MLRFPPTFARGRYFISGLRCCGSARRRLALLAGAGKSEAQDSRRGQNAQIISVLPAAVETADEVSLAANILVVSYGLTVS
jgi:hypothetical protein